MFSRVLHRHAACRRQIKWYQRIFEPVENLSRGTPRWQRNKQMVTMKLIYIKNLNNCNILALKQTMAQFQYYSNLLEEVSPHQETEEESEDDTESDWSTDYKSDKYTWELNCLF